MSGVSFNILKRWNVHLLLVIWLGISLCLTACGSDKTSEGSGAVDMQGEEAAGDMDTDKAVSQIEDADDDRGSAQDASAENNGLENGADINVSDLSGGMTGDLGTTVTDRVYTCGDMTVIIPESWVGKVNVKKVDDGFYFVQKASVEKEPESGFMCGFYRSKEIVYNFAGQIPLASTDDTIYYAQEPTDAPCAEGAEEEYGRLMSNLSRVENSLKVDDKNARYSLGEYVMLGSDIAEIPEDVLINMTTFELWVARNEIYARHGRKFDNFYLWNYFDTCSWYQGTVEGDDFKESVLNEVEKKNIEQIKAMEARKKAEAPYPVRYDADKTAKEDLDGDGKKEEIRLMFKELDGGDRLQPVVEINGAKYDLTDMGLYFETAITEDFYITDIWTWEDGLEIAVLDDGPSNDPVTYFFWYDGELHYAGTVLGFPFKEYQGFDGFYMDGLICAETRADVISSAYAYGTWWADSTSREIWYQDGICRMVCDGAHKLLVDLPMYEYMSEEADTFVMSAGKDVYFVETDTVEWIGVKCKEDRTMGYIRYRDRTIDLVDKEPDEVFSDLRYFD